MHGKVIARIYPPEGMPETGKRIYEIRLENSQIALLKVAMDTRAALRLKNEYQALVAVRGCDGYPQALWFRTITSKFDEELRAGAPALCMTSLPGRSLASLMDQNAERKIRLTPVQAARFAKASLQTLGHLHSAGWIHRDPNPANILLDHARVGFVDLEMAAPLCELDRNVGAHWGVANSYQPPESTSSQLNWGRYSDIYTIAAVAAQACFGTHDVQDVLNTADTSFTRWLSMCLDPDPFRRPQSCAEALALLEPACKARFPSVLLRHLLSR